MVRPGNPALVKQGHSGNIEASGEGDPKAFSRQTALYDEIALERFSANGQNIPPSESPFRRTSAKQTISLGFSIRVGENNGPAAFETAEPMCAGSRSRRKITPLSLFP
jgi:hypothetical protein